MILGDDRHLLVAELVNKGADALFTRVRIGGRYTSPPYSLMAYVALYAEPDGTVGCRLVSVTAQLKGRNAAQFISTLQMPPEAIANQPTHLMYQMPDLEDEQVEMLVIGLAREALGGRDLPVAFVAYLTALTGARAYVLYYPQVIPGEILLRALQRIALRTFT